MEFDTVSSTSVLYMFSTVSSTPVLYMFDIWLQQNAVTNGMFDTERFNVISKQ